MKVLISVTGSDGSTELTNNVIINESDKVIINSSEFLLLDIVRLFAQYIKDHFATHGNYTVWGYGDPPNVDFYSFDTQIDYTCKKILGHLMPDNIESFAHDIIADKINDIIPAYYQAKLCDITSINVYILSSCEKIL